MYVMKKLICSSRNDISGFFDSEKVQEQRYYIASKNVRKTRSVKLLRLPARSYIVFSQLQGNIHCESDIVFELGAYVLQVYSVGFGEASN